MKLGFDRTPISVWLSHVTNVDGTMVQIGGRLHLSWCHEIRGRGRPLFGAACGPVVETRSHQVGS